MKTIILATAIKLLIPLFIVFSIYILFRGHNHPGGGFIGGLIGSIGFVFHTMTHGAKSTRKVFLLVPVYLVIRSRDAQGNRFERGMWGTLLYIIRRKPAGSTVDTKHFQIEPLYIVAAGLTLALLSGLLGVMQGLPFMTALWADMSIPIIGKPGTPILFDIGVYLLVLGIIVNITFIMSEE